MGFIANTSPHNESGQHWVAFYVVDEKRGEFFDSFAHPPEYYSRKFTNFFQRQSVITEWNHKRLQSDISTVCAQYCVYYLLHRSRVQTLQEIIKPFTKDLLTNDEYVYNVVDNMFPFCFEAFSSAQTCCKQPSL